jgi:DNA polymerase-1
MAGLFGKPVIYPDDLDSPEEKGCCITLFLISLYDEAKKKLEENGVWKLYDEVEQPLVKVLAAMEKAGIATDQKRWKEVREDMEKEERLLVKEIYTEAGESFNINSPKQLGHILFEKMGMPAGKKTKTGYSTAADVLEELAVSYPMVKNILRYRTLSKLVSTYLEALPQLIRKETGRIHTSFNQTVTATGRLSSSDPNLQNIPVRTEEGRKIRSLFVPGEGYDCFISSDYSQVELRVLAHMSGDESLIRAFINKEDIHRRTAAEVLGIPFEDVTPEQRSHAKAVNFGIIYGISDFGLARQLGIPRKEAADYIKTYFERYPRIHEFMNSMVEEAKKTGRAVTLFGRYRELPDINSKNFNRRSFAERTAMNTPIQGTAADIMKMAMIEVYNRLKKGGYKSRVLLQVHDELVAEVVKEEKEEIAALLKDAMESVVTLKVPLVADVNEGKNWAETK